MKNELKRKPYWYIKRVIDIILSLILIVITLPLMLITLIILLINLGFPIFNQLRYREGLYKKTFLMLKFRTKKLTSDNLPIIKRYTKATYLIDRLKLNELPQLFNILIGQMSFVGPRPFIPGEKLPKDKISDKRYLVRPGVTSLAFVRDEGMMDHKSKLICDIDYYDNFGFKQDLMIFLNTPIYMVRRFNYYSKK